MEYVIEYGLGTSDNKNNTYTDYYYKKISTNKWGIDTALDNVTHYMNEPARVVAQDVYLDGLSNIRLNFTNLESFIIYSITFYGFT